MNIEADVHPLIAGIVRELPKAGEPMSAALRNRWLAAFESILALLYPDSETQQRADIAKLFVAPSLKEAGGGLYYKDPAPDAAAPNVPAGICGEGIVRR